MVVMYFYLQDLADNPRRVELRRAFTTGARCQPSPARLLSQRAADILQGSRPAAIHLIESFCVHLSVLLRVFSWFHTGEGSACGAPFRAASHFAFLCFEVHLRSGLLAVRGYATPAAPERAPLCCLALHRLCVAILQHLASNIRHFWDETDISAVSEIVESL